MIKRNSFLKLILLICIINSGNAQNISIGVSGSIGFSKVTNIIDLVLAPHPDFPLNFTPTLKAIDYDEKNFVLSGNIGIFLEKSIGKKTSILIEGTWVQINGSGYRPKNLKESCNMPSEHFENFCIEFQSLGVANFTDLPIEAQITLADTKKELRLSYLVIPLLYKYRLTKLGIIGGIQPMFGLVSRSNQSYIISASNKTIYETKNKLIGFKKLDLGAKVGVDYQVANNIKIRLSYYHGFRIVREPSIPDPSQYIPTVPILENNSKNRQLSLGVDYIFSKKQVTTDQPESE